MLFDFDWRSAFRRPRVPRHDGAALAAIRTRIEAHEKESDARLRELTASLREEFRRPAVAPSAEIEALALVCESVRRAHRLTPYDVQLQAGLSLAQGGLVELATGEGKTLVALLPAFCFALRGRGAHVATVNAYLARRDAEFAAAAFARLGLSVGLVREKDDATIKRRAYGCDVTYGVGTEFGFDYLRDQLTLRAAGRLEPRFHEILLGNAPPLPQLLQREHAFAVIDEADSVLIDEARSPLIIAAGAKQICATPEVYRLADQVAGALCYEEDFKREERTAVFTLTEAGEKKALNLLTDEALGQLRRLWPHYIEQALLARHLFRRDVHYVVADDKVTIVDEFTGRLCPDRTWRSGLHQAVEARAGVTISEENCSEATISRPAYFQLYDRVCGMTGTAMEASAEIRQAYGLASTVLAPHRPCRRVLLADRVFATKAAKLAAAAREIAERYAAGQPVLIGTRTIENSEALVAALAPLGIPVRLLNAKQDAGEAAIIAQAGQPGTITIATNMAGRGAHIPVPEESQQLGGLHVIGLERHESARIDRQLIGRGARQGQPGSAQFFVSVEDALLQLHAPELATRLASQIPDKNGELPARMAATFRRVQRRVETEDRVQRRALAAHHRWVNELKQAL
ncbi:MAG TPA: hypothetical protein VGM54_16065 [Chthoniobacter sp.]|jgi:preprotein translocase subunit SecA